MDVILFKPEHPGNVGAIARSMDNFDFDSLVLIEPICDHLCEEARKRATHSVKILKNAKVKKTSALKDYDLLIGTTARLGSDYNIHRSPLKPKELALKLKGVKNKKIGILFGPESKGLDNKIIMSCDFSVTIPTKKNVPTLNLSHAVGIILYELFLVSGKGKVASHIKLAKSNEKKHLVKLIYSILDKMEFTTKEKKDTQRVLWKKIIGKSLLTSRETASLFGFFRKFR